MNLNGDTPVRVQIMVMKDGNDVTMTRVQASDNLGRPTETPQQTLAAAYKDASAWLRRHK